MEINTPKKIGVAIDIDGTIVLKNKIIPGAKEAL
jgi:ribonucleotide monophosphatase NagD (HAD superfamily)